MIAIDTNLLVYAHREDSPWHERAHQVLSGLAEGRNHWAIPWPCVHEFLAIATHPRIYNPPTPAAMALNQVEAWMESPKLVLLPETGAYWKGLAALVVAGRIEGPQILDARIAAICLLHGVEELWSADRDFSRFPTLKVRNPLVS